jgi:hypothetical protein
MSTTIQTLQPRARQTALSFAVAILVALSIGATAGSVIIRTVIARAHPVAPATGWDAQKLQAMEGLQIAASLDGAPRPWDPQKLQAMAGREHAEAIKLAESSP